MDFYFDNPWTTHICSDFHAFHSNICKGCTKWTDGGATRDFDCPLKMTEYMAEQTNKRVLHNHTLIFAGDWSFGGFQNIQKFRDMLNVKTIIFIAGNHDYNIQIDKNGCKKLFTHVFAKPKIDFYIDVKVGQYNYNIGHYAKIVWNKSHHGVRHLYGHSHHSLPDNPNSLSFDVGVDGYELRPLSFIEVEDIISRKTYKPVDHHDKETN